MTQSSAPIRHFKKEAKNLLRLIKAQDPSALMRVKRILSNSEEVTLMRVQHVIAVEYGFSKWDSLIASSASELHQAIAKRRFPYRMQSRTPLGNFLRGPGVLPTPPHLAALADKLDQMTMEEQRRYLDEDARAMGLFRRR